MTSLARTAAVKEMKVNFMRIDEQWFSEVIWLCS